MWNYTDTQVDQQTDTLIMRATLPNPERQLVDGAFVTVEVKERAGAAASRRFRRRRCRSTRPATTCSSSNDEHKVELKRVKTGRGGRYRHRRSSSGLQEGEAVIVDGVQKVRPGQVVEATLLAPSNGG